jgi:hypothetical protein
VSDLYRDVPAAGPSPWAPRPRRQFTGLMAEVIRDTRNVAAKCTRLIRTGEAKTFERYVLRLGIRGWIDYGGATAAGEGEDLKTKYATFVALRPLLRLLVASTRDRAYSADELRKMLKDPTPGVLDGDTTPLEPEDDPTQQVVPESL